VTINKRINKTMELKKVLKAIEEIEKKLNEQGIIKDARLESHLDNLNQVAFELIKKGKNKNESNNTK
tara:strand:- start:523 stop:723 length:201 start_codon:yes stop_codon:yes gene_type:complete